jgi:hypothetical protein
MSRPSCTEINSGTDFLGQLASTGRRAHARSSEVGQTSAADPRARSADEGMPGGRAEDRRAGRAEFNTCQGVAALEQHVDGAAPTSLSTYTPP